MILAAGQLAEKGHYHETICKALGIGRSTLSLWQRRAKAGEEPFVSFVAALEAGTAKAEITALNTIQASAEEDWHAAAWFLERKHAENWGRKDRLAHTLAGANAGEIILSWGDAKPEADGEGEPEATE